MKIKNITDIDGFFKVIDSCQGKVELITGEGDRLNLKSKLCQYVSLTSILKTDVEIPELELVAYEPEDTEKILAESGRNMESIIAYAEKLVSQAIQLRDRNSGNKNRSILKTAVDFIDQHYMEEDMSLNKAANAANVSANHFSALFSQNMGQTFIEYLTSLRMDKAKEYLRCTGMRSSEIAGEVGYKDAHYFSYLFKKTQGMTPSDYRKAREEKA